MTDGGFAGRVILVLRNSVSDSSSVFRPPQDDGGFAGRVILSAAKDLSSAGVSAGRRIGRL